MEREKQIVFDTIAAVFAVFPAKHSDDTDARIAELVQQKTGIVVHADDVAFAVATIDE